MTEPITETNNKTNNEQNNETNKEKVTENLIENKKENKKENMTDTNADQPFKIQLGNVDVPVPFQLSASATFIIILGVGLLFFVAISYGYGTWFICLFVMALIVLIIVNVLMVVGSNETFQIGPMFIFLLIIIFCVYVFVGLYITEDITDNALLIISWMTYTFLYITIINSLLVSFYWSIIRKKTGPPGIRGIVGDRGSRGQQGKCSLDASQSYTIKELTEHINRLYKDKQGTDLQDPKTLKLTNKYLNSKISTMASSYQLNMLINTSATNKIPIANLVSYLKGIWTIWFTLLYDASNGNWFTDEYGDENSSWNEGSQNPFIEMRKYDVFHWGLTRSFRPLKVEVCRSTPIHENGDLPIKRKGKLKIIQSNNYTSMGTDKKTGGNPDVSWWRPKKVEIGNDKYYPLGDVPMSGSSDNTYYGAYKSGKTVVGTMEYDVTEGGGWGVGTINGPDVKTMLVSGDVTKPLSYKNIWSRSGKFNPGLYRPVCPSGYTGLGDVASINGQIEGDNPPVCVPEKCVEPVNSNGHVIWSGNGKNTRTINGWFWGEHDTEAKGEYGYNLMRTDDDGVFYKIKDSCLNINDDTPSTKDLEPETSKLGIGWYGSPAKIDPKYSIFTFLNMLPEGIIVNSLTGRRFYIIHYGGEDVNKFVILDYNNKTSNFDNAIQVDSDVVSLGANLRDISRDDPRQQWIITFTKNIKSSGNNQTFVVKNVYNNKLLFIGLEPVLGDTIFSTIDVSKGSSIAKPYNMLTSRNLQLAILFAFESSVGVQTNVIDNNSNLDLPQTNTLDINFGGEGGSGGSGGSGSGSGGDDPLDVIFDPILNGTDMRGLEWIHYPVYGLKKEYEGIEYLGKNAVDGIADAGRTVISEISDLFNF